MHEPGCCVYNARPGFVEGELAVPCSRDGKDLCHSGLTREESSDMVNCLWKEWILQNESLLCIGGGQTAEMIREELLRMEEVGADHGWVSPLSSEDKEYFAYLRSVFKRYSIVPSKATSLEYDFVVQAAENEFYLQQANT